MRVLQPRAKTNGSQQRQVCDILQNCLMDILKMLAVVMQDVFYLLFLALSPIYIRVVNVIINTEISKRNDMAMLYRLSKRQLMREVTAKVASDILAVCTKRSRRQSKQIRLATLNRLVVKLDYLLIRRSCRVMTLVQNYKIKEIIRQLFTDVRCP